MLQCPVKFFLPSLIKIILDKTNLAMTPFGAERQWAILRGLTRTIIRLNFVEGKKC